MRIETTYKDSVTLENHDKMYLYWLVAERESYQEIWEVLKKHLPREEHYIRFKDRKIYNLNKIIARFGDTVIKLNNLTIKIIK